MIRLRLREIAKERKGWSLYKLAQELDMAKLTIYNWNKGLHIPSGDVLELLCDTIDCEINELFERL